MTTVARQGMLEEAPNGDRFIVLTDGRRYEGKPGTAEYRVVEFEKLGRRIEPAELRNLPVSTKAIPTRAPRRRRRPRRARRALLAAVGADLGARADAARGPAVVRESADGPLVQPHHRGVHVHALQQLPQHRAELHRAGQARLLGRASRCRTSSPSRSSCCCSRSGLRCSRAFAAPLRNGAPA